MDKALIIAGVLLLIIVIIVIIIIICVSTNNKDEKESFRKKTCKTCGNDDRKIETYGGKYKTQFDKLQDNYNKTKQKEHFFATNTRDAKVTPQGTIAAPRIFTNGMMDTSFDNVVKAIDNNQPLPCSGVVGAGKGNTFDTQYESWRTAQDNSNNDPTAVKNSEELEEISKQVSANLGNGQDCMLTRAGATKAKIVLEPLGTAGVMDEYKTPERDRNHKIRMVSYAIHIPGFELDTNRINDSCTSEGSWAKGFAPTATVNIAVAGSTQDESSVIAPTQTEAEVTSFSENKS